MIRNVHEREIAADAEWVGELINSLASSSDRLWPRDQWPAMRLDRPLGIGAAGGHGPVRYVVEAFRPGRSVTFRFIRPVGFHGSHGFSVTAVGERSSVLRHELVMRVSGGAAVTWPLVFRPLHDALIEECLDRAASAAGHPPAVPARRSRWTRLLRGLLSARRRRSRSGARDGRRESTRRGHR
ncbi:SRPBCC family protein [Georgenia sp. Marseille-Q6866]